MSGVLLHMVANAVRLNTIPYRRPFQFIYPFTLVRSFIPVRSYHAFSLGVTDEVYNLVFSPMTAPIISDLSTSQDAPVLPIFGTSHIDNGDFPGE
jgi:hypothetical protein